METLGRAGFYRWENAFEELWVHDVFRGGEQNLKQQKGYIYIYTYRERERQRETPESEKVPSLCKRLRGPQKASTPKAQSLWGKPFTPAFRVLGFRV